MIDERLTAADRTAAGVSAQADVAEHMAAPRFRYTVECVGPSEHDRARYVELRDRLKFGRFRYLKDFLRATAELAAIPLIPQWSEEFFNTVMTAGKNDLLTQYFKGASYTAAFFVGLVDNAGFSAIAAADTSASHAGWTEGVPYSNGTRPALTLGTAASGSIDNSASKAAFTINATAAVNGAFTITNSTKSGSTGILYSAGSFGAVRNVINGDTLNVQVTLSV